MAALSSSSGSSNVPLDDEYDDIERETTSASTEDADDERQPPERSQVVKKARLRRASFSAAVAEPAWNKIRGRNDSDARLAGPDGRVGGGSEAEGRDGVLPDPAVRKPRRKQSLRGG
ncbi:hypothetical protein THAOC_05222 [Thalassiosira oceanica]|uniref:Uncharacterized protein n=1 Tax=Thalassiosira oceanica TaxID=159749 RepID=K0T680_THAOC|nr:hypothetical protein THAOC_05222 [Thalassiosira oceanica]|eukprot:EJK73170.1 hypothetical protein THAOC_05222 [Thalassiosira oceanica]